jgi:hypothetical protein
MICISFVGLVEMGNHDVLIFTISTLLNNLHIFKLLPPSVKLHELMGLFYLGVMCIFAQN